MSGDGAVSEITALIADDEALARDRVAKLLAGRERIRVVGQCDSGRATLAAIRELRPDVVFLDVQMPGLDGFEVLARLRQEERPVIIFSTAYDEYALAAFEVHAVDYLLKPYSDERFEAALGRAEQMLRSERLSDLHERLRLLLEQVEVPARPDAGRKAAGHYLDRIAVRSGERVTLLDADRVDWIEAVGDYVRIHLGGSSHLIRGTLTALERRLDPAKFLRIHRSTIVRLDAIGQLHAGPDSGYFALLQSGVRLRVSRRCSPLALSRLGLRLR